MQGIYCIENTINGKMYIGSSNNIEKRWIHHKSDLRNGVHHSPRLQRAWDKYGEESFQFKVLELVPNKDDLITIEQQWLDKTKCYD